MNIFKSPLLLFGLLVILLAGTALIAPLFIDWGNYRGDFEKYGRQLTGRQTKVIGNISVRLFPWPRMIINDVSIANPPGANLKHLFKADEVLVNLALAPLLSGKLVVEGIEINRPTIGLERMATGKGTWILSPNKAIADIFGAEDIAIDSISITNGTIVLADGSRGGEAQLDGFNAIVSARSLIGPWKLRGEAVFNDEGVTLDINTGKWHKDQPFNFGVRLAPIDTRGLAYSFDGEMPADPKQDIKGTLNIKPAGRVTTAQTAKSDFRPMVFRANIAANFNKIKFTKIQIAPENAIDIQTFIKGDAVVELGSILRITSNLKAAHLDVDTLLGNKGRKTLRSLDVLTSISNYLNQLPANIQLKSKLDILTLVVAGEKFDGAKLDLSIFDKTLNLRNVSLTLPGQTKTSFSGSLIGGSSSPQLIGDLALNGISLKVFSQWLFKHQKSEIQERWVGQQGRFKLISKVDISRENFRIKDGKYLLDDVAGEIGFRLKRGEDATASLEIKTPTLNFDQYAPQGLFNSTERKNLSETLISLFSWLVGERDISLVANISELVLNKVNARDVKLDFDANEEGVFFREVRLKVIGNVDANFSGGIKFPDDNITGSLTGVLKAQHPEKLLQLLGIEKPSELTMQALSPIDVKVTGNATTNDRSTQADFQLSGKIGQSDLSTSGKFTGTVSRWRDAKLHLSGLIASDNANSLFALFGQDIKANVDSTGRFAITATGSATKGLASTADFEAFGVQSQFSGTVKLHDNKLQADGRLAVLSENTSKISTVLGLPHPSNQTLTNQSHANVFTGEGIVKATIDRINLTSIRGTAAGTSFKGDLSVDISANKPVLKLKLATGRLSLPVLIDVLMMPKDGKSHSFSTRLSNQILTAVDSTIEIKTDQMGLWPAYTIKNGIVLFSNTGQKVQVDITADETPEKKIKAKLTGDIGGQITHASGSFEGVFTLGDIISNRIGDDVISGQLTISGNLKGSGRTFGGIFSSFEGPGKLAIKSAVLKKVSPLIFSKKLATAETAEDIENLIKKELRSGDMLLGSIAGKFSVQNGILITAPIKIKGDGAKGRLKATYEIGRNLIDISALLELNEPVGVPAFEIAYAGGPTALIASSNFSALKSQLSVAAINRTLDKLKALEEEQRRLIEEEKIQREEAQKKYEQQQEKQRLIKEKQQELIRKANEEKLAKEKLAKEKVARKKQAAIKAQEQALEKKKQRALKAERVRIERARQRNQKRKEAARQKQLQREKQNPQPITLPPTLSPTLPPETQDREPQNPPALKPLPKAIIIDVPPLPQEGNEPLFIPLAPDEISQPPQRRPVKKAPATNWRKNKVLETR